MDKNLVNIDDLVRQRLLGSEEKERAGAWARMSELLEEEMPRRRGAFVWRRTYSALGILLLVGAISLGGYELNKFRGPGNDSDNTLAASAPAANGNYHAATYNNTTNNTTANTEHKTIASNTTTDNNEPNNTNNRQANKLIAANNIGVKKSEDKTTPNTNKATEVAKNTPTSKTANSSVLASNTTAENPDNQKGQVSNNTTKRVDAIAGSDAASDYSKTVKNSNPTTHTTAVNENSKKAATGNDNSNKVTKTKPADNPVVKAEANTTTAVGSVADNGIITNKTANEVVPAKQDRKNKAKVEKTARTSGAEIGNKTVAVKKSETKAGNKTETATDVAALTKTTSALKIEEKAVAKTARGNNAKSGNVNPEQRKGAESNDDLAILNSSAPAGKPAAVKTTKTASKVTVPVKPSKIAAIPGNTKVKPAAVTSTIAKTATPTTTTASNTVVASATHNKTGVPAGFSNKIPGAKKAEKTGADDMKDVSLVNSRKQKRVIEKLVVLQRYLKTTSRENDLKLDTISMESITEEFEVASAERAEAAKNGNSVAVSENPDMDSSPIKPSASSESFSMSAKEANNKQPVGAKTLENLNAAFNDIKYNAGNATFAMGVTGGINRTFFGPNNFMGFQFGISSVLSFSQSLSLMAELKYFNRINNDYSMHDDYYQYTAQGNGTFKKELVSNPYSIATLQSIELPIAVRYTSGRFNFAVGPNVVYTFNVNAGNYRTVDPNNAATYVSAIGNDNTAKLKADDFNSRFGLGYLFGVSYQVSPKVTIDLRDVQTIWDNAKTDGAKAVSTNLFRSPSFQLSLGYRFGGGKKD